MNAPVFVKPGDLKTVCEDETFCTTIEAGTIEVATDYNAGSSLLAPYGDCKMPDGTLCTQSFKVDSKTKPSDHYKYATKKSGNVWSGTKVDKVWELTFTDKSKMVTPLNIKKLDAFCEDLESKTGKRCSKIKVGTVTVPAGWVAKEEVEEAYTGNDCKVGGSKCDVTFAPSGGTGMASERWSLSKDKKEWNRVSNANVFKVTRGFDPSKMQEALKNLGRIRMP